MCFEENLFHDLERMRIFQDDVVLINLNFAKFGSVRGYKRKDYINAFRAYFGEAGAFAALAYTPAKFSMRNRDLPFFDGQQKATTGAFANSMLREEDSLRTMHPTNSIVAIGKKARELTEGIDQRGGAYDFARRLVELNGKVLLIGMKDYPGFLVHLAEQDLRLYRRYWTRWLFRVKTPSGVFLRRDPGGCSNAFYAFYSEYIKRELLSAGMVNNAYALSIDAKAANRADIQLIEKNPGVLICEDVWCVKCQAQRWVKIWKAPFVYLRRTLLKHLEQ